MMKSLSYFFLKMFFWRSSPSTQLERDLGYVFKNKNLFHQAITHKSFTHNHQNNERLEFLGDAVLSLVLGDQLMKNHPLVDEGKLSKMRSSLVSTKEFYKQAKKLEIHQELRRLFGRKAFQMKHNPRLMASFFEAIIGALYLDAGFFTAEKVIQSIFKEELNKVWVDQDYKTIFQGKSQKLFQMVPEYKVLNETGPAHKKIFSVQAILKKQILGKGKGKTKKDAEQMAAKEALGKFDQLFASQIEKQKKIHSSGRGSV